MTTSHHKSHYSKESNVIILWVIFFVGLVSFFVARYTENEKVRALSVLVFLISFAMFLVMGDEEMKKAGKCQLPAQVVKEMR